MTAIIIHCPTTVRLPPHEFTALQRQRAFLTDRSGARRMVIPPALLARRSWAPLRCHSVGPDPVECQSVSRSVGACTSIALMVAMCVLCAVVSGFLHL